MHSKYKGYLGELISVIFLMLKGFKILHWRYKTKFGEIDIIAKKKNLICFIEVKSRKSEEKCFDAITQKQLKRIQQASFIFLEKKHFLSDYLTRYDVMLISDWYNPIHIKNVSM